MKRALKINGIVFLVVVALSNTPPIQFFILQRYAYRNLDNSFTFEEEPGSLYYETCIRQFDAFKKEHPTNTNTTLYRTFKIKPWQFWEWWQYIAHPKRFSLPYLDTSK